MFITANNYIRMTSLLFNAMGIGMTRHDFKKDLEAPKNYDVVDNVMCKL